MIYKKICSASFLSRPNRFLATVELAGKRETVHVKNTGRCGELLIPGCRVILSRADSPARKTKYDLIAVYKENTGLVNIDSQAPNQVVKEWLLRQDYEYVQPEYGFGRSRLDFFLKKGSRKILMEVKGCTLQIGGIGYFPDAPTERGARHLRELAGAAALGYECYVAFVIQVPGVSEVRPNRETDPVFARAWADAEQAGVKMIFLQCDIKENELKVKDPYAYC